MGDSAKVLEKKSLFKSRQPGPPGSGAPGVKKKKFFAEKTARDGQNHFKFYRSLRSQKKFQVILAIPCCFIAKNFFFFTPGAPDPGGPKKCHFCGEHFKPISQIQPFYHWQSYSNYPFFFFFFYRYPVRLNYYRVTLYGYLFTKALIVVVDRGR